MAAFRNFFSTRSLNSSDSFATSNHNGSEGRRPWVVISAPRSPQVVQPQLRSMSHISNNREVQQQHGYSLLEQEHLHQFGALSQTFSAKSQGYFPRSMGTALRISPMVPQQYDIDRRSMGGFVQMASSARVGGHPQLMPTHLAMPYHASSSTSVEYNHQTLKRKTMITEVPLGSSTNVVIESTTNKFFGFANTFQEEVHMHNVKKMKTMTLSLDSEGDADDAVDRTAREIQFFPPSLVRGQPGSESEFSVYEWSSSGDGYDVPLDLSLKLSSSGGGSGMATDLSLQLYNSCPK